MSRLVINSYLHAEPPRSCPLAVPTLSWSAAPGFTISQGVLQVPIATSPGTPLANISVTMSDGSGFTGSLGVLPGVNSAGVSPWAISGLSLVMGPSPYAAFDHLSFNTITPYQDGGPLVAQAIQIPIRVNETLPAAPPSPPAPAMLFPNVPGQDPLQNNLGVIVNGISYQSGVAVVSGTVTVDGAWANLGGAPAPGAGTVTMEWLIDGVPASGRIIGPPLAWSWDTTGVADGTHMVSARIIDSTGTSPAYFLNSLAISAIVQNSGPVNGSQTVPVFPLISNVHPFYPNLLPDFVTYPGTPAGTANNVHAYPGFSAPGCNNPNLRAQGSWYDTHPMQINSGEYFAVPYFRTTPHGGVFVGGTEFGASSGLEEAYLPVVAHGSSRDGGRCQGTVDPFSTYVETPDGSGFTGVDLTGRVFTISSAGLTHTIAGPWMNPNLLAYSPTDPSLTEDDYESRWLVRGTISGFGDFGGANDLCYDPRDLQILYVAKTIDHCVIKIDLHFNPPHATLYAGQDGVAGYVDGAVGGSKFDEPYSIIMAPDGTMYVADYNNCAIRKIDPTGATVSTLCGGTVPPGANNPAREAAVINNVNTYSPPGTVAWSPTIFTFPTTIRFFSDGNIMLNEQLTLCVREINLNTRTVRRIGSFGDNVGNGHGGHVWQWADVNSGGSCGPLDDIFIANFVNVGNAELVWCLSRDGSYSGAFGGPGADDGVPEGVAAYCIEDMGHYPWAIACSKGAQGYPFVCATPAKATIISSGSATMGPTLRRPRLASDPPFLPSVPIGTSVAFNHGQTIWFAGTVPGMPIGARTSFAGLLGQTGGGHLGSATVPTFDDIAVLYPGDAALTTYIHAGLGGSVPRPEITGRDLRNLIYYIRRCSLSGSLPTNPVPGTGAYDFDVTPPVISSVVGTRLSSTSMRVTWTTDKATIGFAAAGSVASHSTSARYSVWSPIESSYGTSHNVVITSLPAGTPIYFAAWSKDDAGNSTASAEGSIV